MNNIYLKDMEFYREKIKKEILELFGENIYQIFANNQGSPNESEFLESLTFQKVIALNSNLYLKALDKLIDEYREENITLAVDFFESFKHFLDFYKKKDPTLTELEQNFGSNEYKKLLMEKSIEIFKSNHKIILSKVLNKIANDEEISNIFKVDFCQGQDLSQIENKELRNNLIIFSKEIIANSLDNLYRSYRTKPLINFNSIFEPSQIIEVILSEI